MKIVFIVNALHMQRCVKRIDEFAERGYEVEAYGFDRGVEVKKHPQSCSIEVIGKIDSSISYFKRLGVIYNGIKYVLKKTPDDDILYYIFGLDNVMFFRLCSSRKYIYEESDLVHTYMGSRVAVNLFEWIDKRAINKSFLSVFTSEGFVHFHFGANIPENIFVIANRLPPSVVNLPMITKKQFDKAHLSFGFVGFIRFNAIFNFAKVFCENFPESSFHFFGTANNEADRVLFEPLKKYPNCHFHGAFKHPDELPEVYSQLDVVLSTYDVENENVRYAEPNKIYEAIYFETPIVVSTGTFLAEKVKRFGIGYDIDALNDDAVVEFAKGLTEKSLKDKMNNAQKIDKKETLNRNDAFFEKINMMLSKI